MNNVEMARLLGRLDVILETYYKQKDEMVLKSNYSKDKITKKQKLLDEIESTLSYGYNITKLAEIHGKIEQIILMSVKKEKSKDVLNQLEDIFKDIQEKHIAKYKKTRLELLPIRGLPVKAFNGHNIYTVEDISNKTFQELVNLKGISESTIKNVMVALERNGVYIKE